MNPANDANDDARFEALLRDAAPPLADDGFSARVMTALPPAKTETFQWRRIAFCVAGAAIGCAFAVWRGLDWADLESALGQTTSGLKNASPMLLDPMVVGAVVLAALSVLFAFRSEIGEKLTS